MNKSIAILIGLIASLSLIFQAWQLHKFMSAGPRFTARDGQAICERIAELEKQSIVFQRSGIKSLPCDYYQK